MQPTKGQLDVLQADGHLLVTGGPGSGKTTISILKAADLAASMLKPAQHILFLSFARATVSRVMEAIGYEKQISADQKRLIEVDTYHAFFWRLIKTHGYLIGLPRRLSILTPQAEAIALSAIRSGYPRKPTEQEAAQRSAAIEAERSRLAVEEGRVCFDLYAPYVGRIMLGSERIRRLVATMFPVIILDEFQDTNGAQWEVVKALGHHCRLIALADPEQRIFEWIGADPHRLDHFKVAFEPTVVDLSTDNHRSSGTEIAQFANEMLAGRLTKTRYVGVSAFTYERGQPNAMSALVTQTYAARKRLHDQGVKGWTIAVLVPTRKMTRLVSDAFRDPPGGMTPIHHTAVIEMDAAILAADILALLLQPDDSERHLSQFVDVVCAYYQGKGGDDPGQGDLNQAADFRKAYAEYVSRLADGKTLRANSILVNFLATYSQARAIPLTGRPDQDWYAVRSQLEAGACQRLKQAALDARNLRILERGTQLRQQLSEDWRNHGVYRNALQITRDAFVQEHFAKGSKPEVGIVVMNMHKAKGKQFDEVIIFDGPPSWAKGQIVANPDRIVRQNLLDNANSQASQNLRVSITRAKRRTTLVMPKDDPCVLITRAVAGGS